MVFVRKTITIRSDQADWLESHQEFSLSGLSQPSIDQAMIGKISIKGGTR